MELSFKGKKIFAFADTHGRHRMIRVSDDTDILICAGDAVEDNLQGNEYDDFLDWFSIQRKARDYPDGRCSGRF